ncbi:MAG: hypothetical protein NTW17_02165 [Candidatus Pacearchaeota archaeon]|nr:hypothetical protein [Candidatus Pacearchaeota archaeon]
MENLEERTGQTDADFDDDQLYSLEIERRYAEHFLPIKRKKRIGKRDYVHFKIDSDFAKKLTPSILEKALGRTQFFDNTFEYITKEELLQVVEAVIAAGVQIPKGYKKLSSKRLYTELKGIRGRMQAQYRALTEGTEVR